MAAQSAALPPPTTSTSYLRERSPMVGTIAGRGGRGQCAPKRLGRNVGQPNHILPNPIMSRKAERRPGSGEIWLAVTKHDGVQVDPILIDQAKFGEALRQV